MYRIAPSMPERARRYERTDHPCIRAAAPAGTAGIPAAAGPVAAARDVRFDRVLADHVARVDVEGHRRRPDVLRQASGRLRRRRADRDVRRLADRLLALA